MQAPVLEVLLIAFMAVGILLIIDAATGDVMFWDKFLFRKKYPIMAWSTPLIHKLKVGLLGLIVAASALALIFHLEGMLSF